MTAGSKHLCPACGKAATGNFCQHCGAQLGGRFCDQCGAKAAPAATFCNQCGAKMRAAGQRPAAASLFAGQNLPWWIAGATMFVLILVVGVRMVQPTGPGPGAPSAQPVAPFAGGGGGVPPDLSTMTPSEQADRLFNRVMTYVSQGDSTSAQAFLPMAIDAHGLARPLDHDRLFHLALLNRAAGRYDAALATAQEVLAQDPNHLLALTAAAEAAADLGRTDEAAGHYRRVLEIYDTEIARGLPEYADHSVFLQSVRGEAEAFLAGR
jgi:tetratricopeptide (TPR) repeat protein